MELFWYCKGPSSKHTSSCLIVVHIPSRHSSREYKLSAFLKTFLHLLNVNLPLCLKTTPWRYVGGEEV